MPIRLEDFDIDPPRRPVVSKPDKKKPRLNKQQRAEQERSIFSTVTTTDDHSNRRAIAWAIAAMLAATILLGSEKPLVDLVKRVFNWHPAQVVTPGSTTHISPPQIEPPPLPSIKAPEPSPKTVTEQSSSEQSVEEVTNSPPVQSRKVFHVTTSPEGGETQALKQNLEHQRAELDAEKKRLADEQQALDNQKRQDAEEAARASARAKQEELNNQRKAQELENALRAKSKAETQAYALPSPYSGPKSGTLEWDGDVEGDDFIDIANGQPSHGNLTGEFLPGVPVMVTVSPSDSVTISSPPGPSNQWKRIVLHVRAKSPKKVTVKVHWVLP